MKALLDEVSSGVAGRIVVTGEPGVGKTSLLDAAVSTARGFRVLRAKGWEAESPLPFAALAQLLRPLIPDIDQIPAPQAAALRSALRLGPPIDADRVAVSLAVLSVIAAHSEVNPVLLVLEDIHWMDSESAEVVLFASRRFDRDRVATLMSTRIPSELDGTLPLLELRGLCLEDTTELIRSELIALNGVDGISNLSHLAGYLHAHTAGNPLAVIEALQALSEDQRQGRQLLPEHPTTSETLQVAFAATSLELPLATRRALVLVAEAGDHEGSAIATALGGTGACAAVLGPAERRGLIQWHDSGPQFRHPLVRSAIHHTATTEDRRAAHRRLAEAQKGPDADIMRCWHLSHAAVGPDDGLATQLGELSARSWSLHGSGTAQIGFERAAALAQESEVQGGYLLAAARCAVDSGQMRNGYQLAGTAAAHLTDPATRGSALLLAGTIAFWLENPAAAETLALAAEQLADVEPLLAEAAQLKALMVDRYTDNRAAVTVVRANPETPLGATIIGLVGALQHGAGPAAEYRDRLRSALPAVLELDPVVHDWIGWIYGRGLIEAGAWPEANSLYRHLVDHLRRHGARTALGIPLACLAEVEFRQGNWWKAKVLGTEALQLAEELEWGREPALTTMLLITSAQGSESACRVHAADLSQLVQKSGHLAFLSYAESAVALLELSLGRATAAVSLFESVRARHRSLGMPMFDEWRVGYAEALIGAGHIEMATTVLDLLAQQPILSFPVELATARCRATIAQDDASFEQLITAERPPADQFELGRTYLAFGQRLRRTHRTARARTVLRQAAHVFSSLGAQTWAERAAAELTAAGEQQVRRDVFDLSALTPRELQVAWAAAKGAGNREIAETLYLSPKTVEYHLGKAFRKLNVRSRSELAFRVSQLDLSS